MAAELGFTIDPRRLLIRCPACDRVFWPGSHGQRALARVREVLGEGGEAAEFTGD